MFSAVDVSASHCSVEVKQLQYLYVGFWEVNCIFCHLRWKIDELENAMAVFSSNTLIIPLSPGNPLFDQQS